MGRISRLVLVASLLALPVSLAHAETEVVRFPSHNNFANAISVDMSTGAVMSIAVSQASETGRPVYRLFYFVSGPSGFSVGSGILPKNVFHVTGAWASLEVDIADMVMDFQFGDIPANGLITADWEATSGARTSGNTTNKFGNITFKFVGTSVTKDAAVSATMFGAPMTPDPVGTIAVNHTGTIIITKDE